jgi:hypothetical protein
MIIPLGPALLPSSCDLPEGSNAPSRCVSRQAGTPSLFGLAPCGVYPALDIAAQAVRSYRTFSPLPPRQAGGRYVFCGTGRLPALTLESRTLSGTLLCGVRTFLPGHAGATIRSTCFWVHYKQCTRNAGSASVPPESTANPEAHCVLRTTGLSIWKHSPSGYRRRY